MTRFELATGLKTAGWELDENGVIGPNDYFWYFNEKDQAVTLARCGEVKDGFIFNHKDFFECKVPVAAAIKVALEYEHPLLERVAEELKQNSIKQHIPGFVDGVEPTTTDFTTTEELLQIPFVKNFTTLPTFCGFAKDAVRLVAVYKDGKEWCVVGYLKLSALVNLPTWEAGKKPILLEKE